MSGDKVDFTGAKLTVALRVEKAVGGKFASASLMTTGGQIGFYGTNLTGANFEDASLATTADDASIDFAGAVLTGANFAKASLATSGVSSDITFKKAVLPSYQDSCEWWEMFYGDGVLGDDGQSLARDSCSTWNGATLVAEGAAIIGAALPGYAWCRAPMIKHPVRLSAALDLSEAL